MHILTDCPAACNPLKGPDPWRGAEVHCLPAALAAWWRALSGRTRLWRAEAAGGLSQSGLGALVVIDHAPCSQFSAILEALHAGFPLSSGVAALALAGEKFRGQGRRTWSAVRGNLHLCVLYAPEVETDRLGAGPAMLPTVAVMDVVRSLGDVANAGIKWANDVYVADRKVAGALTATRRAGRVVEQVLFGIGVNVEHAPATGPTRFVPATGCLADAVRPAPRWVDVLPELLRCVAERYCILASRGPGELLQAYRADSLVIGRRVRVWPEDAEHDAALAAATDPLAEGVVTAIDPDLSLRLAGRAELVRRGRITWADRGQ